MSRISLLLVVLLALVLLSLMTTAAGATVIEVPLPGLLGIYDGYPEPTVRTVGFRLVDPPSVVYGASLRVSGTTEVGTILCETTLTEWPTMLGATMEDTPLHLWYAFGNMPYVAGPFAWTEVFTTITNYEATWNFLLDGTGEISMQGGGSQFIMICSPVSAPPALTVTEAVLIINAEFPIRVEPTTWGRIKALYRNR